MGTKLGRVIAAGGGHLREDGERESELVRRPSMLSGAPSRTVHAGDVVCDGGGGVAGGDDGRCRRRVPVVALEPQLQPASIRRPADVGVDEDAQLTATAAAAAVRERPQRRRATYDGRRVVDGRRLRRVTHAAGGRQDDGDVGRQRDVRPAGGPLGCDVRTGRVWTGRVSEREVWTGRVNEMCDRPAGRLAAAGPATCERGMRTGGMWTGHADGGRVNGACEWGVWTGRMNGGVLN